MFRPGNHATQHLIGITLAVIVIFSGLITVTTVSAQEEAPVKLNITPVDTEGNYFDLTLEPGETRELSVQLANTGSIMISARTYPADAYTIVNGGFGAREADESTSGTTHWIDYKNEILDLEPGETVTRMFTLNVPDDAQPGQYLTALVIENTEPVGSNTGGGVGFNQIIRQAIAVAVRIPGPDAPALQFGQASHAMVAGSSTIRIEVLNVGNVHLVPYGELTLTDSSGAEVTLLPIKMSIVYSGTETLVDTGLPELLEAGEYTATLTLQEGKYGTKAESGPLQISVPELVAPVPAVQPESESNTSTQPVIETQIVGVPTWMLLVAIPLTLILGIVIAFVVLKRRMQPAMATATGSVAPQVTVRENPPAAASASKPISIRQMKPPTKSNDTTDDKR